MNPGDQAIVREVLGRANQILDANSRSDNKEAREALAGQGVIFVDPTDETRARWEQIAAAASKKLIARRAYDRALLAEIEKLLETYRAQKGTSEDVIR
jgi:TRAP-type C4-dicarboxylate transport system substrate-binding protein